MQSRHPILAGFMRLLCNHGYSPARVLLWAVLVWAAFGVLYAAYPLPKWLSQTEIGAVLCAARAAVDWDGETKPRNGFEPFYFSAVTMVTLGYGEIHPANLAAQVYAMLQTLLGYILLALLVASLLQRLQL
jgi:hypothetical protein